MLEIGEGFKESPEITEAIYELLAEKDASMGEALLGCLCVIGTIMRDYKRERGYDNAVEMFQCLFDKMIDIYLNEK